MTRTTISILAALMLGGASAAYAGGAGKSSSDQTSNPARSEAGSSASGTTSGSSGMSAGESSTSGAGAGGAAAGSASQMSEADVQAKLQKQGYTQVSGVKKVGDKFEAKAMKNGKSVNVEVDPATGMVKDKG